MSLSTITIGGVDYQAYVSIAEASAIVDIDPIRRSSWMEQSDDEKARALVAATNRLDLLGWLGERAGGATQATAWPRKRLQYSDGTAIAEDAIPAAIERATALLAGSIVRRPAQADQGRSGQSIAEVRAGPTTVRYFRARSRLRGTALQDETAWELVKEWIGGSVAGGPRSFGTDEDSAFTERDRFGFNY